MTNTENTTERFTLIQDGKNWRILDTQDDNKVVQVFSSRSGLPASSLASRAHTRIRDLNENARKAETDPKLYWLDGQWRRDWS